MLQVARLAPRHLRDAVDPIRSFLLSQLNADGGGKDRAGVSDLYYTVFVLEGLMALQAEVPTEEVTRFLEPFADGGDLDLVHLCCLARCWAAVPGDAPAGIAANIERFRSADGGYAPEPGVESGTVYHGFMCAAAHQDLGGVAPDLGAVADGMERLRTPGEAWAVTTVSAAAMTMLRYVGRPIPHEAVAWMLERRHPQGGFVAVPDAPMPDLLSTATALHALAGAHVDLTPLEHECLDFMDTLWTGRGFCGNWADDVVDAEYTYYGLLSIGHLSV